MVSVYFKYSSYKCDPIKIELTCDDSKFTGYEKSIIDSVIKNLCCYSGKTLERYTHLEAPWLKTRGDLPASVASTKIISKKLIGEYFVAVKERYEMLDPSDIEIYAKRMFEKIN